MQKPQILAKQQSQIVTDLIATNGNHSYETRMALFFRTFIYIYIYIYIKVNMSLIKRKGPQPMSTAMNLNNFPFQTREYIHQ